MSAAWFINEDGEVYDHDVETQAEEFPDDDHTPYATQEEAGRAVDETMRQMREATRRDDDTGTTVVTVTIPSTIEGDLFRLTSLIETALNEVLWDDHNEGVIGDVEISSEWRP